MSGFAKKKAASEIVIGNRNLGPGKFFSRSRASSKQQSENADFGNGVISVGTSSTKLSDGSSLQNLKFEISLKHFDILGIVGEGAFGKVKRIERKKKHTQYALKYIDKKKCVEKHATQNIFRERMVLQSLNHPYVVNLRYAFQDDDNLFMVLDIAEGGDLRCHLDRMKGMKDDTLVVYAAEISYALDYLHRNFIIHRDLKPENLLLDKDGHILLTDFNVCANLKDSKPSSPSGTRPYMAPEMFAGKPYSYSVDWWAMGIILYECTYGKRPYKVEKDWTPQHFESVKVPYPEYYYKSEVPIAVNPDRDAFYRGLLCLDRHRRLGASNDGLGFELDIKTSAYMKSIDWTLIANKKLQPVYRPNVKALNIDSALLIDEIIGGGDGLAYKARKGSERRPSFSEKLANGFKKLLGIKPKEVPAPDPNAPPPVLSREQQEFADMDKYYTNYNWELPDQQPMTLPPKPKKERKEKAKDGDDKTKPKEKIDGPSNHEPTDGIASFQSNSAQPAPGEALPEASAAPKPEPNDAKLVNAPSSGIVVSDVVAVDSDLKPDNVQTSPLVSIGINVDEVQIDFPHSDPASSNRLTNLQAPTQDATIPRTTSRRKSRLSISMADQVIIESPLEEDTGKKESAAAKAAAETAAVST
ncbi:hypothetical protein HDV03_004911 [Kappamyces sp. JEL0829]|nr:hypothetical protein HDV03_004911 [Kappamyces sp. JEL0829]